MSDRRERPTLRIQPLSMREMAEQRLLELTVQMATDAMRAPLLPPAAGLGAIPVAINDEADTLPLELVEQDRAVSR